MCMSCWLKTIRAMWELNIKKRSGKSSDIYRYKTVLETDIKCFMTNEPNTINYIKYITGKFGEFPSQFLVCVDLTSCTCLLHITELLCVRILMEIYSNQKILS